MIQVACQSPERSSQTRVDVGLIYIVGGEHEDSSSQVERLDCSEPWSQWTHCANFIPPRGFYLTVFVQLILEPALGDVLYGRALGSRLKSPQTCYTRVLPVTAWARGDECLRVCVCVCVVGDCNCRCFAAD